LSQTFKRGDAYTPDEKRRIWDAYERQMAKSGKVNWSILGRELGHNRQAIQRAVAQMLAPPAPEPVVVELPEPSIPADLPPTLDDDRAARRANIELREIKQKYTQALDELHQAEARFDAATAVRQPVEPIRIETDPSINGGQATAIMMASDWHVGERVDAATVNGLNTYTPEIAEQRAAKFFQNGLKLVNKERQDVRIDNLILWLGGDLITGYIHPELEESNYLSPTEEAILVKRLVIGGLKMLRDSGEFKQILVVCSFGNHGRTTEKRRISTGYKNSFEWMTYCDLAALFEDDPIIKFQVTSGYLNYVRCYDYTLRFHHGDNVRFQGGVGGVTIPLNKFIARTNQQQWADCDFLGHFHQLDLFARWRRFCVNGSLIGFNSYAQAIGASPEPPQQGFQLLDSRRGFTIAAPILVGEA